MVGYGQFCPIAQAAEVLTERWTPLVIRELALAGSHRFNEIQRGVPLMSSSLLTKRLRQLERAGIIERRPRQDGMGNDYHLTRAGEELGPLLEQMGVWGECWLRRPVSGQEADAGLFMWWMRGTIKRDALPPGRHVIHFRFRGAPEKKRYFWLLLPEGDVCLDRSRLRHRPHGSQRPQDRHQRVDGRHRIGGGASQARSRTRGPRAPGAKLPEMVRAAPARSSQARQRLRPDSPPERMTKDRINQADRLRARDPAGGSAGGGL